MKEALISILEQSILMVALVALFGFIVGQRHPLDRSRQIAVGLLFGLAASSAMLIPINIIPGFIFDVRAAILSLAPIFIGPLGSVIAGSLTVAARLALGGAGAAVGAMAIVLAVAAGFVYQALITHGDARKIQTWHFFGIGLVVHATTLVFFILAIPGGALGATFPTVAPLFLAVAAPLTGVLGMMLFGYVNHFQTVRALQANQALLRNVIRSIPDLVWLKDVDGVYLACNQRFENFAGASENVIVGKTVYDFSDKEQAEFFRKHDRAALAAQSPLSNEETVTFASDGHVEELETIKTPLFDTGNKPIGVLGIGRDITERKKLQTDLERSLERFQQVFEHSPTAKAVLSQEGRLLRANRAFAAMLGYRNKALVDLELKHILHPDELARSVAGASILPSAQDKPGPIEVRFLNKGGQIVSGLVSVLPMQEADSTTTYFLDVQDLRGLRAAESLLATSEQRFRLALENIPDVVVLYDTDLRIRYINIATKSVTHRDVSDYIGRSDRELWPPSVYNTYLPALEAARDQGIAQKVDADITFPDGRTRYLEIHCVPIVSADGSVREILGINRDMTEMRSAQRETAQSLERLNASFHSIIDLVTTVVDARDPYTSGHQRRVGELAAAIAEELNLPATTVEAVRIGGYVHDIGNIRVPQEFLSKAGPLSDAQLAIVKEHANAGYDMLKQLDLPWPIADIAHQHHERTDGSGYPQGLSGDAICLEARIVGVADVIEAMASHRPYRPALSLEIALQTIDDGSGKVFDPAVVKACLDLFRVRQFALPE